MYSVVTLFKPSCHRAQYLVRSTQYIIVIIIISLRDSVPPRKLFFLRSASLSLYLDGKEEPDEVVLF
jgi:hypothetical protein